MSSHAKLSPSGASRWMRCSGSLGMSRDYVDESSEYADEGTAAHYLGQVCLEAGIDTAAFLRQWVRVSPDGECELLEEPIPMDTFRTFEVTEEFAGFVQVYVDAVRTRSPAQEYEVKLDLSAALAHPDQFGTADTVVQDFDTLTLEVHDLKFGRGVQVFAEKNEQLMLYAAGAALRYEPVADWQKFRVFIHQPRLNHQDDYEFGREELVEFVRKARQAGSEAMKWLDAERIPRGVLEPGEKQCKWCPANGACPAYAEWVEETTISHFDDVSGEPIEHYAHLMDEADLAVALERAAAVENWLKAVRGEALRRALEGKTLPRFKLVAGRAGARKWADEDEAIKAFKRARLKKDEMYDLKLISPTKAEKMLAKDKPRVWKKIQTLVTQSEGGLSLAPEDDKRPAQKAPRAVADDFDDLVGGDVGS